MFAKGKFRFLTLLGERCSLKEKIKYKKDCEIAYPQSNKEFKI